MPFVNIKLTSGASNEQKQELIAGVTDLLVRVLDKNPASTHVVIEEIVPESWGIGGESVALLRQRGVAGGSKR